MLTVRQAETQDLPVIWALSVLPNVGYTANPYTVFPLPPAPSMPAEAFADLADPDRTFTVAGGELLVAELDGHNENFGARRQGARIRRGLA